VIAFWLASSHASAGVPIYGGPTFDTTTNTGFQALSQETHVGNGVAVASLRLVEAVF
jgi:hypothetical protein